jgi:hypothetical protein
MQARLSRARWASARAVVAVGGGFVVVLALWACGGAATPPTPVATATPTPVPTPTPDPNIPPAGSGCGKPYPPMITRFKVGIHFREVDHYMIDSTPLVGPDIAYCAAIGLGDRSICPIRPEGADDRLACELWRVGIAKDTGQPGPTWTVTLKDGTTSYCTGPTGPCDHHPAGPFSVKAFQGGLYRVCSEAGACGEVDVDR